MLFLIVNNKNVLSAMNLSNFATLKVLSNGKDCKEVLNIPNDQSVLMLGTCGSGKTEIIKKHIANGTFSKKPLVVSSSYHKQDVAYFEKQSVQLLTHSQSNKISSDEINTIKAAVDDAIKNNQDIFLDEMPIELKTELLLKYFESETPSRLIATLQWIDDLNNPYLVKYFDCVFLGRVNSVGSLQKLNKLIGSDILKIRQLKQGQFIPFRFCTRVDY